MFDLKPILSNITINESAVTKQSSFQIVCVIQPNNNIVLRYSKQGHKVLKVIPWFQTQNKNIATICFNNSGSWLLVICVDSSLHIVPTLSIFDSDNHTDCQWAPRDVTTIYNKHTPLDLQWFPILQRATETFGNCPSALLWWQTLEAHQRAIIGYNDGTLAVVNLLNGDLVGWTKIPEPVKTISISKDNSLEVIFLLITSKFEQQWKLILEKRSISYTWPNKQASDLLKFVKKDKVSENVESNSSSDTDCSNITPTARSRLQSLRHLSVEKLGMLKTKLSESRLRNPGSKEYSASLSGGNSNASPKANKTSQKQKRIPNNYSISQNFYAITLSGSSSVQESFEPERVIQNGDMIYTPQYSSHRHMLAGYQMTSGLLRLHNMDADMTPIYLHKLPENISEFLFTERLIFAIDITRTKLYIISCSLSSSRFEDDEFNNDSIISTFTFDEDEDILRIFKVPMPKRNSKSYRDKVCDTYFSKMSVDECLVITRKGLYMVTLRKPLLEQFMEFVSLTQLENCESMTRIFSMDISQCLEIAADILLDINDISQATLLYNLSQCHPLKTALKLAARGHVGYLSGLCRTLIEQPNLFKTPLTPSALTHISNFLLMVLTETSLRNPEKLQDLYVFLSQNQHYDIIVALNIATKTELFQILCFLVNERGVVFETIEILCKILQSCSSRSSTKDICKTNECLQYLSDQVFLQCFLCRPNLAEHYFNYINSHSDEMDKDLIKKLVTQLNPWNINIRHVMSSYYYNNLGDDNLSEAEDTDFTSHEESESFCKDLIETHIFLLLELNKTMEPFKINLVPCLPFTNPLQPEKPFIRESQLLSSGFNYVCLIRNNLLYSWGRMGTPTKGRPITPCHNTVFQDIGLRLLEVSCGKHHTLVLTNNGVYSYGSNIYGQLGIDPTLKHSPYPRLVLIRGEIVSISAGQYHSIALTSDGRLYTWGWNLFGQLGHGHIEDVPVPAVVNYFRKKEIVAVSAGHAHSVVLTSEGNVYTFGSGDYGQLGNGTNAKRTFPILVELPEPIKYIKTSYFHNLALTYSNTLYTWGLSPQVLRLLLQAKKRTQSQNIFNKSQSESSLKDHLANTEQNSCNLKSAIITHKTSTEVVNIIDTDNKEYLHDNKIAGQNNNIPLLSSSESCLTKLSNEMEQCSLNNINLDTATQVTDMQPSDTTIRTTTPQVIAEDTKLNSDENKHFLPSKVDLSLVQGEITKISTGCYHSCLITTNNALYSWGVNLDYQLGTGNRKEVPIPTLVSKVSSPVLNQVTGYDSGHILAKEVSCGSDFTILLGVTGKVIAFGNNNIAQCGKENDENNINDIEGCRMILLKSSRRILRFPHTGQFCCESATEVENIPSMVISFNEHKQFMRARDLPRLNQTVSHNPWDIQLHAALQLFFILYNDHRVFEKCIELNNFQAAAKLLLLKKAYDSAFKLYLKSYLRSAQGAINLNLELFIQVIDIFLTIVPELHVRAILTESFMFMIEHNLNMKVLEKYLLSKINQILLPLSNIVFFGNNAILEKQIMEKYTNSQLINNIFKMTEESQDNIHISIVKHLSPQFCLTVCQALIEQSKVECSSPVM